MALHRHRSRRGASARSGSGRGLRATARILLVPLLGLAGIAAIAGLAFGGWHIAQTVAAVPVARVVFSGELQYVGRDELIARVQPELEGSGFFTIDLEALRAAVETLPWVDSVAIIRRWPNELEMVVSEQQPIAHWGDESLLNHHGELFTPGRPVRIEGLPVLHGPAAAAEEVVEQYGRLAALLAEHQLHLAALEVDERGSWAAVLDNGVRLDLGERQLLQRAVRFVRVYNAELADRFEQVAYIDLRYANGLAVGWKAATEQRS